MVINTMVKTYKRAEYITGMSEPICGRSKMWSVKGCLRMECFH